MDSGEDEGSHRAAVVTPSEPPEAAAIVDPSANQHEDAAKLTTLQNQSKMQQVVLTDHMPQTPVDFFSIYTIIQQIQLLENERDRMKEENDALREVVEKAIKDCHSLQMKLAFFDQPTHTTLQTTQPEVRIYVFRSLKVEFLELYMKKK